MDIDDTTIARLKQEAKESHDEDFQIAKEAGIEWAKEAPYSELRLFHLLTIEDDAPRYDVLRHIFLEHVGDMPEDLTDLLRNDDGRNLDQLARGFLAGIDEFISSAKAHGVPFQSLD